MTKRLDFNALITKIRTKGKIFLQKLFSALKRIWIRFVQSIAQNKVRLLKLTKALTIILVLVISPYFLQKTIIYFIPASQCNENQNQNNEISALQKEVKSMQKKLALKTPSSYYLIVNSSANEFMLYKGNQLIKKDKCSTGSYVLLTNENNEQWMFKTPKGMFRIQGKTTSPVWKKPDWAFVEAGLPIPSANDPSRFEYGVLGDYALSLGDGYLIHGTLYQRFLGLPVTHGCIRLNDENLKLVFNSLSIGSKVYIY